MTLVKNGRFMIAVYFGDIEEFQEFIIEKYKEDEMTKAFNSQTNAIELDITYRPDINEYRGNNTLQVVIEDYR